MFMFMICNVSCFPFSGCRGCWGGGGGGGGAGKIPIQISEIFDVLRME